MYSLLNEIVASWTGFIDKMNGLTPEQEALLSRVFSIISTVLWVVLAIVGVIGSIYAIYLGVQLARADEQAKRDDAKKHLTTTIIAVGVTLALILVFNVFLPMLLDAFHVGQSGTEGGEGIPDDEIPPAENMINLFSGFVKSITCRF